MILLSANNIARYFGSEVLFENIQLEIQDTSRLALVGRNGAGKSTLLKIICGKEMADKGEITQKRGISIGYLAQNTGLESEEVVYQEMLKAFAHLQEMEQRMRYLEGEIASGAENMESILSEYDRLQHDFKEQNGYGYESETRSVLHGFQFDESFYDRKISELSGGQRTRLALAKLLLQKPEVLILDEPTNHLDIETLSWLEGYLQNYRGALLIVSHDRYFLDKVATETLELSRRKLRKFTGNYSKYLELKEELLQSELKEYEKQQSEIAKLEDFVARNLVRASTTKRAQSRRKQLEKMERMEKPLGDEKSVHFGFQIEKPSGNVVLQLENGAVGYDGEILSEPIDLDIRRTEAIALVGPNGIGKSTLLKSIVDKLPLIKGEIRLGAGVSIGYYDQEQANLTSNKTVLRELWDEHATTPEKDIRNVLGGFLFSGEDVEKTIPLLSGGEKARVALAKLSMNHENFLVLDEPTNHLDIDNKEVLENALIDYAGTLLFVSHDRYFINRIATKIIELSEKGTKVYLGDYDYYLEKKEEEEAILALEQMENGEMPQVEGNQSIAKQNYQQSKESQRQLRALTRKIEQIEQEMSEKEDSLSKIQEELEQASYENNLEKLTKSDKNMKETQEKLDELMEEWASLSLELEELE
ncbi:ATP-binding cassette, subfamily F, member 3 [Pilibacter termitis]|uniref:ATP-binding cassette, subfamily F, member 3 n=1 Tax=Pilibacter termitis TaxID=263852 RepID=A0A1T4NDK6_9ENTE|nr:ABC-F family ATP-binding cassette domain-containing protein [Pilibacter termitis]SJZ76878.1 ATP-binding cassette, subfamily F, member 3 [Pilibacter termitis]